LIRGLFHPSEMDGKIVPTFEPTELEGFAAKLLSAGGVSEIEATSVAASLIGANLRGHDSHGVMRIPYYLGQIERGELKPGAELTIRRLAESIVVADGNWGFGQTQATRLTDRLIRMARTSGVAIGTIAQCCHIGRLGEYCETAASAGLVSMLMVNTHGAARRVAPPGGIAPRLGTNPIAFGIPHDAAPLVVDFGTSATAEGKVRVKKIAGEPCPDGWLIDSHGRPTNDPNSLYSDPPGTILPMGGPQAYKGFALGLVVEIFAGALSGGVCIREKPINPIGNCVFMQIIDPAALGGAEHFAREVDALLQFVRDCPREAGVREPGCLPGEATSNDEITLAGDPERRMLDARSRDGIPLDEGNWTALVAVARRLGVAVPS
jgi:uncharacterized oxidoreductase